MRGPLYLLLPYTLLDVVVAQYSGRWCPAACDTTLNYATFNDTDIWLSRKIRSCRSEIRITSLYLCLHEYCKDDTGKLQWLTEQTSWCNDHANATLPSYRETVDGWKPGQWDDVRKLSVDEAMQWPTINEVIVPDFNFFSRAFTTTDAALWEYELHLIYGLYMYYFWILVVAIGIGTRLLSAISRLITRPPSYHPIDQLEADSPQKARSVLSYPQVWLRRYLTVPAAFGERCSRPLGWCTIPPRIQSLTIFLFVLFNVVLCSCSYRLTEGNLYWPEKSKQLLRYVSDRTGIISLVNFPLVWLFGMRNDFLMWITGWGFGTYNAFHRWVARVATLQAVVHSIGYTWMILESGGWPDFRRYWTKHYFWNGELATMAMCALLAFSFYGIRRAHYEIFLVTHIVLSIVALWTMYYHVEIFISGEWNVFIWPCLAIWIFDRTVRLGRIFMFNRRPLSTFGTASYDTSSNLVRLDVDGSKNMITPKPGTYYYIHLLDSIFYAHQSHPFTLAYISSDTNDFQSTPLSPISSRHTSSGTASPVSVESNESDALLESADTRATSNLVFLIRPYDGFTARLRDICISRPAKVRVLVEGPYGHDVPLQLFPNVLFVVGGTGIAVPLSHLHRLLQADSHVQSIKIVWAVREHAFLESVLQEFSGMLGDERLELEVHVTRADQVHDEVLGESTKRVRVVTHRPNVSGAVEASAKTAGQTGLAVVACGPALMADQARMAAVDMLKKGYTGVEYFEESFKW